MVACRYKNFSSRVKLDISLVSLRSLVGYRVAHSKRNFISWRTMYYSLFTNKLYSFSALYFPIYTHNIAAKVPTQHLAENKAPRASVKHSNIHRNTPQCYIAQGYTAPYLNFSKAVGAVLSSWQKIQILHHGFRYQTKQILVISRRCLVEDY